eukprot:NODE_2969_length_849_cov_100.642317.p1 GENE.NODE_2969_length_849_cov_100.642317~~NODE_2969_length_849_cov_100.642317.p1  ORF type:complete len:256 (+),score=54.00 NODE_2969_length_849_cov_100.642317:3-770(+)
MGVARHRDLATGLAAAHGGGLWGDLAPRPPPLSVSRSAAGENVARDERSKRARPSSAPAGCRPLPARGRGANDGEWLPAIVDKWTPDACGGLGSANNPQVQLHTERRALLQVELHAWEVSALQLWVLERSVWGVHRPLLTHALTKAQARRSDGQLGAMAVCCECEVLANEVVTLVAACSVVPSLSSRVKTQVYSGTPHLPCPPPYELRIWTSSPVRRGPTSCPPAAAVITGDVELLNCPPSITPRRDPSERHKRR